MIRYVLACSLAVLVFAPAAPVAAQPAAAIGKPLPDASMRDGTLSVRVIAGDRAKPVTGADVTLTLTPTGGTTPPTTQIARTDAEGRAAFSDIPEAIQVKVTTPGPDGAVVASSPFPMPQTGGMRLMLSTAPMADAGAGPMAGGQGPMTPRTMSGQPRPEPADAVDTITARISYDDFADAAPLDGVPVALIAYRYDQTVTGRVVKTDAAGRAEFTGVDRRGATAYFALTLMARNGVTDRLTSIPIMMNGEAGVRVMLSADNRGSTAPPVDDLTRLDDQPAKGAIAAGEVRAALAGVPEVGVAVELVDALTGAVVQTQPAGPALIDYDTRSGAFTEAAVDAALAPGSLALTLTRDGKPATGASVWVRPVTATEVRTAPDGTADANGAVTVTGLATGVELELVVTSGGDSIVTQRYTLPASGGLRSTGALSWTVKGEGGARFTGVSPGADRAYAVRTTMRGQVYVSAPFQLTPERGAAITVLVMPRVMFSFSLTSWIDDVFMGVRGQFGIRNASWAPYVASTDGRPDELTMPLPAGFSGALVRDEFQSMVGVDPSRGFVIRRPIPPGGYQFIAGFSLKIDDGEVRWNMPLPLGAFESGIEIKADSTGAQVDLPGVRGTTVEEVTDERGKFLVISPITILPGKSMVFTVHDLPQAPAWRRWSKKIVGVVVLVFIVLGAGLALWRPRTRTAPAAHFDGLLDELAALEATGAEPERRAKLMAELEGLYREVGGDGRGRAPGEPG